uniref:Uncharacterized protein n=1 Tax=Setaria italica TaxID=4555 RepID=K3YE55_SETIT
MPSIQRKQQQMNYLQR